jgi:hypothetical protein
MGLIGRSVNSWRGSFDGTGVYPRDRAHCGGGEHYGRGDQARGGNHGRLQRYAGRGGPLGGGHPQPGVPADLRAARRTARRPTSPVRLRSGTVLLVAAGRVRHLRRRRRILHLPGRARARAREQRQPAHRLRGPGHLRPGRGNLSGPRAEPAPRRGPPRPGGSSRPRPPQPRHYGQGDPVRRQRGDDRPRTGRAGTGPAAGHRITGLGRRGLHRHRRPARRGGGQARPGQPGLPHRPRRRPERAGADPGRDRERPGRGRAGGPAHHASRAGSSHRGRPGGVQRRDQRRPGRGRRRQRRPAAG